MPPRKPPVIAQAANGEGAGAKSDWVEADNGEGAAPTTGLDTQKAVHRVAERIGRAVFNLEISGIITFVSPTEITWRTGHLEHIANLFAGDPQTTERVYADDLAVARAYSAETWERLTNG